MCGYNSLAVPYPHTICKIGAVIVKMALQYCAAKVDEHSGKDTRSEQ